MNLQTLKSSGSPAEPSRAGFPTVGFLSGKIFHVRLSPKSHEFVYPYFCFWLNLDETDQIRERHPQWFSTTPGIIRLRRADYFGNRPALADDVRALALLEKSPENQVYLLGQLNYLGRHFSPVNFYFIGNGQSFHTLLAEVSNTPWNEKHYYTVPLKETAHGATGEYSHGKDFHVSPFMNTNQDYHWRIHLSEDRIRVAIHISEDNRSKFSASLNLQAQPLNRRSIFRVLVESASVFMSTKFRIYWQALKLWFKGIHYVSYPGATGNLNREAKPDTELPSGPGQG